MPPFIQLFYSWMSEKIPSLFLSSLQVLIMFFRNGIFSITFIKLHVLGILKLSMD